MPGDDAPPGLTLRIENVHAEPAPEHGSFNLQIETSRGPISAIFQAVEGGTGAVVCVGGAAGGMDGPGGLYARLAESLVSARLSTLRVGYRAPNNLEECVLDVLAGCSFLAGVGASDLALVGHSFGGAVVIMAGQLAPAVRAVASLSPQLFGTRQVEQLGKPLLLIHGTEDTILSHEASEDIYRRARDPKRMILLAETGHGLREAKERVLVTLTSWLGAMLDGVAMESGVAHEGPDAPPQG